MLERISHYRANVASYHRESMTQSYMDSYGPKKTLEIHQFYSFFTYYSASGEQKFDSIKCSCETLLYSLSVGPIFLNQRSRNRLLCEAWQVRKEKQLQSDWTFITNTCAMMRNTAQFQITYPASVAKKNTFRSNRVFRGPCSKHATGKINLNFANNQENILS